MKTRTKNTAQVNLSEETETTDYSPMRLRLEKDLKRVSHQLDEMRASRVSAEMSDGAVGELEEEATESAYLGNMVAQEQRVVDERADIEAALKKFTLGTYGLCEKCGRPITLARLEAVPTAKLCIADALKNKPRTPPPTAAPLFMQ